MNTSFGSAIGWVLGASILGFAITIIFAARLKFKRTLFLVPYILLGLAFIYEFFAINRIDAAAILQTNLVWGLIVGLLVSAFLVRQVRSQPRSRTVSGPALLTDLMWAGLLYGLTDALFLNVMPVVAIWAGTSQFDWAATLAGRIGVGALGMVASLFVAFCYHLGYPEFWGNRMRFVFVGNAIITGAFLVSGNPLGAIIAHAVMHIAAVLQGAETTVQLPPHYEAGLKPA